MTRPISRLVRTVGRTTLALACIAAVAGLLSSCSGGDGPAAPADGARGARITQAPTLAQVQTDLARAGKPLPDFLAQASTAAADKAVVVKPASVMQTLALGRWAYGQSVPTRRTSWYECYLSNAWADTDVIVTRTSGDPDLYVFTPLWADYPEDSLQLVGYSLYNGSDQVGSFWPDDFGGTGRYVIAVYGYASVTSRYNIRCW